MYHFQLHIRDYTTKTRHLSLLEDGVFNRLLRIYYDSEKPLPVDLKTVQRLVSARARDELSAVESVLHEFFVLEDDGWHNARADQEIADYHAKSSKARESANARWDKAQGNANAMRTHAEGNANRVTVNRITDKEQKATVEPAVRPTDRFPEFWAAYPNKQGKQEAWKRWRKDKLDGLADEIISHVHLMKLNDDGWQRGYAPMGSTYLNQARWTDEPRGPTVNRTAPGKQMTGLMALEEMKHGLVPQRDHHGHPEARLSGLGATAGRGSSPGDGFGLAGSAGPRLALGSGNGHATNSRGVLDIGPDGYRLADSSEAD